ncbi:MAG TPA: hypothetical protein VFO62_07520 [Candidatus Binatia bacterium]|nr:hypothetical protein [Candidatus Binatia bacterium]
MIAYDVAGAPLTDTASRIDARLAFLANDAAGRRTVAFGPSLIDCKGQAQPLGITLLDTVLVGDEIAFAIPTLTIVGAASSLRIFADYGAVLR